MQSSNQKALPKEANLRWLAHYVGLHRFAAFMAVACGMAGGVTAALEPYLIGVIIDHLSKGVDLSQILQDIALLVGFSLFTLIAFYGQRHYSGVVAYGTHYDMRKSIFSHLLTLDVSFYERFAVGDLISRMYSDLQYVWRLLAIGMNRSGSALMGLVITFVLLASVDMALTVIVFIVLTVSTAFQMWAGLAIVPLSERVQDQQAVISSLVQDTVSGIQTLKSFGREADAMEKFRQENLTFRREWLYFKRRNEPVGLLPQAIANLASGVVVVVGGFMTLNGQMSLGNFTQFLLYLTFISKSLLELGTIYQRFMQAIGALKRITPLLQDPRIADKPTAQALQATGEIRFEQVGYRVGDKWLLRGVNLTIQAGQTVGLVGATGSGKTTLVNLLARTMDVSEGRVLVDGVDVRDWQLDALRLAIAYVPQSTFLFSQPLHENIRMGRESLNTAELENAVHLSRLSNDLPQLPHGLETLVGEKGVMLSGGQKQRVAIARAIARNAPILVLDDALSSVDTHTAGDILNDMRHVLETRTSVIIAHRIATVKDADVIVVLDEGGIVEQGTHAELVAKGGQYAQMVARELAQSEGESELPTASDSLREVFYGK